MTNKFEKELNTLEQEKPPLPQVGSYICPMCQGRGVCSRIPSETELKAVLQQVSKTSTLEVTGGLGGFHLSRLSPRMNVDNLQQLHPRPTESVGGFIPAPTESIAIVPTFPRAPLQSNPNMATIATSVTTAPNVATASNVVTAPNVATAPNFDTREQQALTPVDPPLDAKTKAPQRKRFLCNKHPDQHLEDLWPSNVPLQAKHKEIMNSINARNTPKSSDRGSDNRGTTAAQSSTSTPPINASKRKSDSFYKNVEVDRVLGEPPRQGLPQEALRIALTGLQSSNWQDVIRGLQGVLQVSRWQPALLEPVMPVVNRTLIPLLRGLRSQVTRLACQTAGELFKTMQFTQRPEFDELVGALLIRTSDLNRFIRQDANEALDSLVTYVPPQPCARALVAKASSHKYPLVRAATARLLTCCSVVSGPGGLLIHPTRDGRASFLSAAASLLCDPNKETRSFATKLFESLIKYEDFDNVFQSSVDGKLYSQVEKAITVIKFNKHKTPP